MTRTRKNQFGGFQRRRDSRVSYVGFKPTQGWYQGDAIDAPPGSMVSGKNVWIVNGALRRRDGLSLTTAMSPLASKGTHWWIYASHAESTPNIRLFLLEGGNSTGADAYSSQTRRSWMANNDNSSTGGGSLWYARDASDNKYTEITAEPRQAFTDFATCMDITNSRSSAVVVFCDGWSNNPDAFYAFGSGQTSLHTTLGEFSQGGLYEKPRSVTMFDNSPIFWGCIRKSQAIEDEEFKNIVVWPQGTDYTNWNGVGSGYEELIDSRGAATRIFTIGSEMLLATTQELWRGRFIGGAYRFEFQPMNRELGMPLPAAALKTPMGVVWLNDDYMMYHYDGNQVRPIGGAIQEYLRENLALEATLRGSPRRSPHFITWDQRYRTITLHYAHKNDVNSNNTADGSKDGMTYHFDSNVWTPQKYSNALVCGVAAPIKTNRLPYTGSASQGQYSAVRHDEWTVYFMDSTGSLLQYDSAASLDAGGNAVEGEYVSGALFGEPLQYKMTDEVRVDAHADSASSLSIALTSDLGTTYAAGNEQVISVRSNTSQIRRTFTPLSGMYHGVRIRSEETGWEVNRLFVRARGGGLADY